MAVLLPQPFADSDVPDADVVQNPGDGDLAEVGGSPDGRDQAVDEPAAENGSQAAEAGSAEAEGASVKEPPPAKTATILLTPNLPQGVESGNLELRLQNSAPCALGREAAGDARNSCVVTNIAFEGGRAVTIPGCPTAPCLLTLEARGCAKRSYFHRGLLPGDNNIGELSLMRTKIALFAIRAYGEKGGKWIRRKVYVDGCHPLLLADGAGEGGSPCELGLDAYGDSGASVFAGFGGGPAACEDLGAMTVAEFERREKGGDLPPADDGKRDSRLVPGHLYRFKGDGRLQAGTAIAFEAYDEAEPSVTFVVKVGEREVKGAKIRIAGQEFHSPFTRERLDAGDGIGPFEVTYSENGKRYKGAFNAVTVGWLGPKTFSFPLKEDTVPRHGDRKTLMLPGGEKMDMVYVSAPQEFYRGSANGDDDERPVRKIRLTKGYWLGAFEVTQGQWRSVVKEKRDWCKNRIDVVERTLDGEKPMYNVSWDDCQLFAAKIQDEVRRQFGNFKASLPTEAQWECACRAGSTGDYAGDIGKMAWNDENSGGQRHHVGTKAANAWGFHDMHGNVWEWCLDKYDSGFYGESATVDPCNEGAAGAFRVCRGGGLGSVAGDCRSSSRNWLSPDVRSGNRGFRIALVPCP